MFVVCIACLMPFGVWRGQLTSARPGGRSRAQAVVTFDLDADLRSVFSWNTKQLFVYLQVEYETEKNKRNQIVLWDSIIQQKVRGARLRVFAAIAARSRSLCTHPLTVSHRIRRSSS